MSASSSPARSVIAIEIWSDVVCPWCAIGKQRFDKAMQNLRSQHPDIEFDVSYQAFELDPTAPVGVDQAVYDVYVDKFGGDEAAKAMMQRVTDAAAEDGITFRLDIAQRSNTRLAHRLLVFAAQNDNQHELKARLMQAYFTEGRRIGDAETLIELATEVGLDPDNARQWLAGDGGVAEVADQLATAAQLGITGVPTYVFTDPATGDRFGIPGAASSETIEQAVNQLAAGVS